MNKEIIKIFAFDSQCILKSKKETKLKYHLSRIKWLYRYLTAK